MSENEFEYDGKLYKVIAGEACADCSMWICGECVAAHDFSFNFPPCSGSVRKDGVESIFVEVQDERAKG